MNIAGKPRHSPRTSAASRTLRRLMRAYPAFFRQRYSSEMVRILADERDHARYQGLWGSIRYWGDILIDILVGAARMRIRAARANAAKAGRRDRQRGETMDRLFQDLRYAVRTLTLRPGWTLAAVATLALGIGATTAIFSLVDHVLLRPLPYPEPERLVTLQAYSPRLGRTRGAVSYPVSTIIAQSQQVVDRLGLFGTGRNSVEIGAAAAELMLGGIVSWEVLDALAVPPMLGRGFQEEDDRPGAADKVLLSYGLWKERFAADPEVLGRSLRIGEKPHAIIGVMPPGFGFPQRDVRYWVPMSAQPRVESYHYLETLGRLRTGLSAAQADAQLRSLQLTVPSGAPGRTEEIGIRVATLLDWTVGEVRPQLLLFLGAVAVVLLIACLNVVSLMLSRSAQRARELALRSALGAGRGRLVRQILTEATLLGLSGGLLGSLLSVGISRTLLALAPIDLPRSESWTTDGVLPAFAVALSLAVGVLIGIWPALRSSRPNLSRGLQLGGRTSAGDTRQPRLRAALVVVQIGLALTLLVNAGLLLRTFEGLASADPGFSTASILAIRPALPMSRYSGEGLARQFFADLLERIRALPQVETAAATATVPFGGGQISETLMLEGETIEEAREKPSVDVQVVEPEFFRVLAVSPLRGRILSSTDREGAPGVVLVNETFVRQLLEGEEALGRRIRLGDHGRERWSEIVGVVPDIRPYRPNREILPMVFESADQDRDYWLFSGILIRTRTTAPEGLVPQMREIVRGLDAGVPLAGVTPLRQRFDRLLTHPRFRAWLLSAFGISALLLAVIGVYGVVSNDVVQRRREIGVRLALGARRSQILNWVGLRGARLAAFGLALGLLGSLASTRLLESYLFGVAAYDTATFALSSAVLLAAAMAAGYLPARHAGRIDPVDALRCE